MQSEISNVMKKTYNDLLDLETQIEGGVAIFNPENLHAIISKLHTDSNKLATKFHDEKKIKERHDQMDNTLKQDMLKLIKQIQHSSAFNQALGTLQVELTKVLTKIETSMKKWESKVEKADNDFSRK